MLEIDKNEFYMGININQMTKYYYLFQNKKSEKDETQSQFSQLNQQLFALFTILAIIHNKHPANFFLLFSI